MALKPTDDLITTKEPWVTLDMAGKQSDILIDTGAT